MQQVEPTISIIISTYNNPTWLEKTLWGYMCQTCKDFEIVIADDGSKEETKALIEKFRTSVFPNLKHIWHPDNGFEKTKILNKAIVASTGDYLIFTDHDCIPRADFVKNHIYYATPGYILSGGYFKLPMDISELISKDNIEKQLPFDLAWLHEKGLKKSFKCNKLSKKKWLTSLLNTITPTGATWNGCNSSGWKKDILAVNGFNEEMQYGGEDREMGERMFNMGIKAKQLRYSLVCVHLDHERPYKNTDAMAKNKEIRRQSIKNKTIKTPNGIEKS